MAAGGAAAGRGETEPPTLSQAARGKVTVAPSQAAGRVVPRRPRRTGSGAMRGVNKPEWP